MLLSISSSCLCLCSPRSRVHLLTFVGHVHGTWFRQPHTDESRLGSFSEEQPWCPDQSSADTYPLSAVPWRHAVMIQPQCISSLRKPDPLLEWPWSLGRGKATAPLISEVLGPWELWARCPTRTLRPLEQVDRETGRVSISIWRMGLGCTRHSHSTCARSTAQVVQTLEPM